MKRKCRHIIPIIITVLFLVCLVTEVKLSARISCIGNYLYADLTGEQVTPEYFKEMREAEERAQNIGKMSGWWHLEGQPVAGRERIADAAVYGVAGSTGPLLEEFPGIELEESQCVISTSLSWKLFGTTEGKGRGVDYQEQNFQVVKTIDLADDLLLVSGTALPDGITDGQLFMEHISVVLGEEDNIQQLLNTLNSKYSLTVVQKADTRFLKWLMGELLAAAARGLLLTIIWCNRKRIKSCLTGRGRGYLLVAGAGVGLLICWISLLKFHVPREVIPSRWSNFEFWPELAANYRGQLEFVINRKKELGFQGCYSLLSRGSWIYAGMISAALIGSKLKPPAWYSRQKHVNPGQAIPG